MADALGSLVISLQAETAQFRSEMEKSSYLVSKTVGDMTAQLSQIGSSLKEFAGAVAAAFTVDKIVEWGKTTVEAAAKLSDLSKSTGSSVESLSKLANQAQYSGASFEQFQTMVQRLAAGLGGVDENSSRTSKALQALGIEARDPAQALQEIADKFETYADGANKAALARDLFGKGGVDFINTLHDMATASQIAGTRTTEQAEAAEQLQKQLRLLSIESNTFKDILLSSVVPTLNAVIERFREARAAGVGLFDSARLATTYSDTVVRQISDMNAQLEQLRAHLDKVNALKEIQPTIGLRADAEKTMEKISQLNKELQILISIRDKMAGGQGQQFWDSRDYRAQGAQGKDQAPTVGGGGTDAAAKVTELQRELQRLAEISAKADLELAALFSTDKITEAERELTRFMASDAWDQLTMAEQIDIIVKAGVSEETEKLTNKYKEWAAASGQVAAKIKEEKEQYLDLGKKQVDLTEKLADSLDNETKYLGLSNEAKRVAIQIDQIQAALTAGQIEDTDKANEAIKRLTDSLRNLESSKAARQAADDAAKAWKQAADDIERSLENALFNGFKKGQSFGEELKSALEQMFRTLVLRPLLQPIANGLAGLVAPLSGAASGAGGGIGSLLQGAGSLTSLFGGGGSGISGILGGSGSSLVSTIGDLLPAGLIGTGASTGIAGGAIAAGTFAEGAAVASGAASAGLAAAASMIPVVGWALAAAAIAYSIFGNKGGGPKGGGFAQSGSGIGRYFTPNDQDKTLAQLASGTSSAYSATLAQLGGSGSANFAFGFDTDPQGTAQDRLSAGAVVNGQTVYSVRDQNQGRGDSSTLQANLQLESQRALLAALQASDLPKAIAAILNTVAASGASADAIARVTTAATAYKTLGDIIGSNAAADALKLITTQSEGAFGALGQMGDALRSLMANYKGTTDQTNALVSASQQYYAAEVQLLAQTQQVRTGLQSMFTDTIRGFRLSALDGDKPGQYAFLQNEAQTLRGQLSTATDPTTINTLVSQINADLNQAFGLLDTGQRQSVLDQFIQSANDLNAAAQERLQLIEDTTQQGVRDTLAEAQQLIADTATTLQETAQMQHDAAQTQLDAANTPITINFNTNVTGTLETNFG